MDFKNKLISIAGYSYLSFLISRLLGFLFLTFAFHRIGKDFLGLWFFVLAFISYFRYLWGSLDQSFIRNLSRVPSQAEIGENLSGDFLIMTALGLLSVFLLILLDTFLISYFPFSAAQKNIFHAVFNIMIGYVFLLSLTIPLRSLTMARQMAERVYLLEALQAVLNYSVGILILIFYPSLKLIMSAYLLIQFLILAVYLLIEKRLVLKILKEKMKLPPLQLVFGQLRFSSGLFLLTVAGIILYQADVTIIAYFLPIFLAGIYGTCQTIYRLPYEFALRIAAGILPATSYLHKEAAHGPLKKLFLRATKYSMLIYFPIAIPLFIYAYPLLNNWFDKDFAHYGAIVLYILFLHQWFEINHAVGVHMLEGLGKVRELLIHSWACAILNLILSLILIQRFGLSGVALGTTIPFIVFEFYLLNKLLKHLKVSWPEYLRAIILPVYLPLPIILMAYFLFIPVSKFGIITTLLGMFLTGLCLSIFYFVGMTEKEKAPLLSILSPLNKLKKLVYNETTNPEL